MLCPHCGKLATGSQQCLCCGGKLKGNRQPKSPEELAREKAAYEEYLRERDAAAAKEAETQNQNQTEGSASTGVDTEKSKKNLCHMIAYAVVTVFFGLVQSFTFGEVLKRYKVETLYSDNRIAALMQGFFGTKFDGLLCLASLIGMLVVGIITIIYASKTMRRRNEFPKTNMYVALASYFAVIIIMMVVFIPIITNLTAPLSYHFYDDIIGDVMFN